MNMSSGYDTLISTVKKMVLLKVHLTRGYFLVFFSGINFVISRQNQPFSPMKNIKIVAITLIFISSLSIYAQDFNYVKAWEQIESLQKKGQPAEALKQVDQILQQSVKDGESIQKLKCLIYKSNNRQNYAEDANLKTIEEVKNALAKSEGVEKAMLFAALSDAYLQYYRQNQWTIRQRKDINGQLPERISEWSQRHFQEQINSLIIKALSYEKELKATAAQNWKEVFVSEENSFNYQPFLFDFVAWKAIDFYSSEEFTNQAKEDLVLLNNPAYFHDYASFTKVKFQALNQLSNKEKTLFLYQKLARFHKGRKDVRPLLWVESQRMDYLSSHGVIDDKDQLIQTGLEALFQENKGLLGSEIIARQLLDIYTNNDKENESSIRKAVQICQFMIDADLEKKYFSGLKNQINQRVISLDVKDAIIPMQSSMGQIRFKNIDHVWFKIVKINSDERVPRNGRNKIDFSKYLQLPVAAHFDVLVAKRAFLVEKSAIFQIPELDNGHYAIIASSGSGFNSKNDVLSMGFFWSTKLQLFSQDHSSEFIVVDRESGKPIVSAEVKAFSSQWEYSSRSNVKRQIATVKTDKNGEFSIEIKKSNHRISLEIAKGNDEWISKDLYIYCNHAKERSIEKHYFFTDRAIYRPGQTVYFKGILTEQTGNIVKNLANKKTEVSFYSTQGKKLQSLSLTSNEYGSVSGSFICPVSGLNGNMRISDGKGSVSFKMEEYKRPKFQVILDTPDEEYSLNEEINVRGAASYYAGVGVQNATVKFRVMRSVYMPWRWSYWPIGNQEMPITAGEVNTDDQGGFTINFIAIAPAVLDGSSWYDYAIIAEVTDASGETHTQTLHLNVGSQSLYISADLPEVMDASKAVNVLVKARTANHKKVASKLNFRLEKLKTPKEIIQESSWDSDTILISKDELHKNFKHFAWKDNISDYDVDAIVLEKTMDSKVDSIIPKSIFESLSNGVYRMTLTAKDKNAKDVKEIAYTTIFSSKSKKMPYQNDFFFILDEKTVMVGDTAHFSFGSSFQKLPFYYQISRGQDVIESSWKKLSNQLLQFDIPIRKQDRGGFNVQIFFERNDHIYSFNEFIDVPFDNKELDVQLVSFRNPMQPGQKEKWSLQIKNKKGDALAAEILAGMYDASLDVFAKNNWSLLPYRNRSSHYRWHAVYGYFYAYNNLEPRDLPYIKTYQNLRYAWVNNWGNNQIMLRGARADQSQVYSMNAEKTMEVVDDDLEASPMQDEEEMAPKQNLEMDEEQPEQVKLSPRKNLRETAFFYPQLTTDKDGDVQLNFTSPEALSKWKLMVLATTKNMEIGALTQEFITQKELMVMPNLPRFLRGGDHISLSSKVINLLDKEQNMTVELEILDAKTMQSIHILSDDEMAAQEVKLPAKSQANVIWKVDVPETVGAVIIRVLAKGKEHSDGEEHMLPVLSQLHFLTDTYPFSLSNNKSLDYHDLGIEDKEYNDNDELTLEMTTNPLWYVIQALPNYQQPQTPAALSWFNYYFVNAMAANIVEKNPQIETVFKQWQQESPDELESELSQDPKLKQILLEETPWLRNAENQRARKQEIARLFDKNNLANSLDLALNKLRDLQRSNGGFAWYKGMRTSVYITAQILEGLGQLKKENIIDFNKNYTAKNIARKAVKYLDAELMRKYLQETSSAKKITDSYGETYILQARAYFLSYFQLDEKQETAYDYYLNKWGKNWAKAGLITQMKLAKTNLLFNKKDQADAVLLSIKDKALRDAQGGIYWRDLAAYSAPENQAAMIELFEMVGEKQDWINGLKIWLLQQKRANDWGNGMATAKACYAMLSGAAALNNSTDLFLSIDGKTTKVNGNAGIGYFQVTWRGKEIAQKLNGLKIRKQGEALVFGAFYEQHFEKMSEVERHNGGVELEKKVFVAKTKDGKNELFDVTPSTKIELGDRILVRLTFNNEQAMDFVHLRDYLPAGFENQQPLSAYRWQGNLGFYQSPSDIATDYFIYHLPKGEFVIEYELNATSAGILNLGPAEMQSLYAPEFGGHSEGGQLIIEASFPNVINH
jgi:uncharacterized protein YfaS (alpha-2-macroglobulin family)